MGFTTLYAMQNIPQIAPSHRWVAHAPSLSFSHLATPPPLTSSFSCCRLAHRSSSTAISGLFDERRDGSGGLEPPDASTEDACEVAQSCMRLFTSGDTADIISHLPDAVIDNALDRKRSRLDNNDKKTPPAERLTDDLSFAELLELSPPTAFSTDAFAMRGLVFTPPAAASPLSTLRVTSSRCLQRYSVKAASGEDMVIVFDLQLEEALEPRYRSFGVVKKWFLKGLTGESAHGDELPLLPAPEHGPEAIVAAQLAALKSEDARGVFAFASRKNKSTFRCSVERFSEMLGTDQYSPLLGHSSAQILQSTQMTSDRNFAVVGVVTSSTSASSSSHFSQGSGASSSSGGAPQRFLFGWSLSLQEQDETHIDGDGASSSSSSNVATEKVWVTEGVYPLGYGAGFFAM